MKKRLGILLLIILTLGIGFFVMTQKFASKSNKQQIEQTQKAGLKVADQNFDISKYIGKNALEATTNVLSGKVEMTGTSENAFVTSINGRKADSKKHEFWELIVNGKSSDVGAGSYIIKNYDQIEWKINNY